MKQEQDRGNHPALLPWKLSVVTPSLVSKAVLLSSPSTGILSPLPDAGCSAHFLQHTVATTHQFLSRWVDLETLDATPFANTADLQQILKNV